MFPLSSVLLPFEKLPLHIFENRYRAMIADCVAADSRFGVVLIERGSEVGGGDVRHSVGCVAKIEVLSPTADGGYGLLATGVSRLAVKEWRSDSPYPKAVVEVTPDHGSEDLSVEIAVTLRSLRELRELWAEMGEGLALPDELQLGATLPEQVWRLCSATPLGPLDRQRLIEAESPGLRLSVLASLISEIRGDFVAILKQRED